KCRPSRIRRATLRTTLESSTMRQDFMSRTPGLRSDLARSCRIRAAGEVEDARDVEHDEERDVEPVDARGDSAPGRIERRGIALGIRAVEAQHLADAVDQ